MVMGLGPGTLRHSQPQQAAAAVGTRRIRWPMTAAAYSMSRHSPRACYDLNRSHSDWSNNTFIALRIINGGSGEPLPPLLLLLLLLLAILLLCQYLFSRSQLCMVVV